MEAVKLVNIWKRYDGKRDWVLLGVTFSTQEGKFVVIVGPNGSGKTTLLKIIVGLLEPAKGEVYINGRLVYSSDAGINVPPEERGVGYVPQDVALFPHMSVYDNIAFGPRIHGLPEHEVRERVEWAAKALGVENLLNLYPQQLSGGQAQRVAIARALALKPHVLLLDEPFSHIDPWSRGRLRRLLRQLTRKTGMTVVMTSHDLEDAREADEAYILHNGVIKLFYADSASVD
ncbi:ABC transporter ATP-binding protein [Hyperthermus butylicus]|uniref:Molybdate/tungstate import ATP-binding protein WtpC n=1 Tax=Hyperthermus butylicus (strain DSM 5456 / JCM 9403 / PLM1-5) TaxID=415426 RepID=A2BJT7_HYPBU|nr:ABC transporter ATP-binding protein [Hyperthermus butylicus]ABM80248.1 ABC (ATP-binding cassette) transporter domain [Hyperthermus butylicus DSM 5456]